MSRLLSILFAALFLGSSAVALFQYWDVQARDLSLEAAQQSLKEADAKREAAEKSLRDLNDELARLKAEAAFLNQALADARKAKPAVAPSGQPSTPAGEAPKADGMAQGMAEMFKTEAGRKMMKTQGAMVARMTFGGLTKQLNLSKEDSELVMGMVSDRQTALTEMTFAAMDGPMDEQKLATIAASSDASLAEYDSKFKAVLGEAKFQQMKDYERSIGDRMMLSMSQSQFTGSPLVDNQRDDLLKIMSDTRKSAPAPVFDPANLDIARGLRALQDDTSLDRHMAQEAAYQQKVLAAATRTLNPDQINALQKGFEQNMQMQKFQIEMSRGMFGKKPAAGTPVPPAAQ